MLSKLHSLHRYYQEQVLPVCAASATRTKAAKGIVLLALPGMKPITLNWQRFVFWDRYETKDFLFHLKVNVY